MKYIKTERFYTDANGEQFPIYEVFETRWFRKKFIEEVAYVSGKYLNMIEMTSRDIRTRKWEEKRRKQEEKARIKEEERKRVQEEEDAKAKRLYPEAIKGLSEEYAKIVRENYNCLYHMESLIDSKDKKQTVIRWMNRSLLDKVREERYGSKSYNYEEDQKIVKEHFGSSPITEKRMNEIYDDLHSIYPKDFLENISYYRPPDDHRPFSLIESKYFIYIKTKGMSENDSWDIRRKYLQTDKFYKEINEWYIYERKPEIEKWENEKQKKQLEKEKEMGYKKEIVRLNDKIAFLAERLDEVTSMVMKKEPEYIPQLLNEDETSRVQHEIKGLDE